MRDGSFKRLLQKELLEVRRPAVAMLAIVAILLLLRDPLSFREEPWSMSGWVSVPLVVAFLMGLSAYSRELAGGTLPFLLSRPVGAWRLAAAKLLAGNLACLAAALFAALLYAVVMPSIYRPHAGADFLVSGAIQMAFMMSLSFLTGMCLSMLAPGLGTSLAVTVAVIAGILYAGAQIGDLYPGDAQDFVILAGVPLAALASVAPRALLDPRRRLLRWFGVVAASVLASAAMAFVLRATDPRPSFDHNPIRSPDFARKVYTTDLWPMPHDPADLWLETGEGQFRRIEAKARTRVLGWAPDSRSLLYALRKGNGVDQLRTVSEGSGWTPRTVLDLPVLPLRDADLMKHAYLDEVEFSPSGRRVAMHLWDSIAESSHAILTVDLDARRARVIPVKSGDVRLWWIDDTRLVLLCDGKARILPP